MAEQRTVLGTDAREVLDFELMSLYQRVARAVQVAWELGVWQALLAEARSAERLAADLGFDEEMTRRLLRVLASTGLAWHEPDGTVRLTQAGRDAFDPDSPVYYGDGLAHAATVAAGWNALPELLRGGLGARRGGGPGDHRTFVMAMQDYSIRGRAQWLAGNIDLTGRRHLLDLGGGPGTYSFALLEANPELRATIFDLPQTEPLARDNAARYGLAERVAFRGGDYDQDDLGGGYDCALASNVLHGAHHGSGARLKRLAAALEPGALVIIQDFVLDDDGNGPLAAAMFGMYVGVFRVEEMLAIMAEAGLLQPTLRARGAAGSALFTGIVA